MLIHHANEKNPYAIVAVSLGTRNTLISSMKDIFNWNWHIRALKLILYDERMLSIRFLLRTSYALRKSLKSHSSIWHYITRGSKLNWRRGIIGSYWESERKKLLALLVRFCDRWNITFLVPINFLLPTDELVFRYYSQLTRHVKFEYLVIFWEIFAFDKTYCDRNNSEHGFDWFAYNAWRRNVRAHHFVISINLKQIVVWSERILNQSST